MPLRAGLIGPKKVAGADTDAPVSEQRVLTLTRKIGQKILIGNGIEVVVREIRGRQVRLGIVAPDGLPVFREELYQDLAAANVRALSTLDRDRVVELPEPAP